jgi:hypothetical protein
MQIRKTLKKIQIEKQIKYEENLIQKEELIRKYKEKKRKEIEEMVNQTTKLVLGPSYWDNR